MHPFVYKIIIFLNKGKPTCEQRESSVWIKGNRLVKSSTPRERNPLRWIPCIFKVISKLMKDILLWSTNANTNKYLEFLKIIKNIYVKYSHQRLVSCLFLTKDSPCFTMYKNDTNNTKDILADANKRNRVMLLPNSSINLFMS